MTRTIECEVIEVPLREGVPVSWWVSLANIQPDAWLVQRKEPSFTGDHGIAHVFFTPPVNGKPLGKALIPVTVLLNRVSWCNSWGTYSAGMDYYVSTLHRRLLYERDKEIRDES